MHTIYSPRALRHSLFPKESIPHSNHHLGHKIVTPHADSINIFKVNGTSTTYSVSHFHSHYIYNVGEPSLLSSERGCRKIIPRFCEESGVI